MIAPAALVRPSLQNLQRQGQQRYTCMFLCLLPSIFVLRTRDRVLRHSAPFDPSNDEPRLLDVCLEDQVCIASAQQRVTLSGAGSSKLNMNLVQFRTLLFRAAR